MLIKEHSICSITQQITNLVLIELKIKYIFFSFKKYLINYIYYEKMDELNKEIIKEILNIDIRITD